MEHASLLRTSGAYTYRGLFLGLFSSMEFPSATCFIVNKIAFYKYLIESNSVRLRMQQVAYSPRAFP
jgi:hypothetical protein